MSFKVVLGTDVPLIQAPMASVQDSRLALAACTAGALGSLPAAMLDAASLEKELRTLQDAGRPYNVNFFAHQQPKSDPAAQTRWRSVLAPFYRELDIEPPAEMSGPSRRPFGAETAEVLESFSPTVVSFHFGLPSSALLARVKARGAMVISSATTVEEALWLQANGCDAVIAQGLEAGGHRGHFLSTDTRRQAGVLKLVQDMVGAVQIPVIAAGGIADAAGVRAAVNAGASAVQVGTAFLLCLEATTGRLHRERLRDPTAATSLTNLFSGGVARGLSNRLMRELGAICDAAPPFPLAATALAPLRAKAEGLGRDDFTPLWSGSNRSGCREVPAAEVVASLATGWSH